MEEVSTSESSLIYTVPPTAVPTTPITEEYLEVRVVSIGHRWHARLIHLKTGQVLDEMACELRVDISFICRTMLRWHAKCGGTSPMAWAARERLSKLVSSTGQVRYQNPIGRIWYKGSLDLEKEKRSK